MKTGTLKFDGISIGELTANFMQGPGVISMKAKVAFVNSKTGATHGWTTQEQWSPAVLEKLKELAMLMEEDVSRVQFSDAGSSAIGASGRAPDPVGGLGEHLKEEAPQI